MFDITKSSIDKPERVLWRYQSLKREISIEGAENGSGGFTLNGAASTTVRVCFNGSCQDNHTGRSYTKNSMTHIYADDARGIPLKIGNNFVVTELTIHSARQAIQ